MGSTDDSDSNIIIGFQITTLFAFFTAIKCAIGMGERHVDVKLEKLAFIQEAEDQKVGRDSPPFSFYGLRLCPTHAVVW